MLKFPRRLGLGFVASLLLFTPVPAMAFWEYGHQTVGELALANVTPHTRAAVEALLAKQALLETPTCPAGTIADAAVWADCVKEKPLRDRFSYMSSWHFQDHDVCKAFDIKEGCKDGNCLSTQIERQMRLLKDRSVPERERLIALILLVHFIGDLEQPLHAAEHESDAGGNGLNADYGIVHGKSVNLHKIWDGYLAERAISTQPELVHAYPAEEKAKAAQGSIADWMRESWAVARDQAYATALGPDYCGRPGGKNAHGAVSEAGIEALVPVMRDQVVRGGLRLASLLDQVFDPA